MNVADEIMKLSAMKAFQYRYENDWRYRLEAKECMDNFIERIEARIFEELNRQSFEKGYIE